MPCMPDGRHTGHLASGAPRGQANCQERFDRPNQKPSMTLWPSMPPTAWAAPRLTKSGAQCSVRGWASCAAGALSMKSRIASTSPASDGLGGPVVELEEAAGGALSGRRAGLNQRRLWVVKPRADDQRALVAQRREPRADVEQLLRVEGGHRQLEHRDVGLGEHLDERHVGAVVEPARRVLVQPPPTCAAGGRRRTGPARGAGRRVVGAPRSTSAGSPRSRRASGAGRRRADRDRGLLPVGRDDQDARRPRQVGRTSRASSPVQRRRRRAVGRRG